MQNQNERYEENIIDQHHIKLKDLGLTSFYYQNVELVT
jgi:hypothetical protein